MNHKKKHEIEALAGVVNSVAREVKTNTVVDVGSGQGYLAQVLSFEYQLSVVAVDASSHHGKITDARAERIRKHYAAKARKSGLEHRNLSVPKTVTCHVLSPDILKSLGDSLSQKSIVVQENLMQSQGASKTELPFTSCLDCNSSFVLAGLHACGDLSVTMLRTFLESSEAKAVVSIGCCYNLLSAKSNEEADAQCGFPMSEGAKSAGLSLGKNARDLACQSAERWSGLGKAAGLHNFQLHAFRAAFQMVLFRYYPELVPQSPAIGRQGKALRRQQHRRMVESSVYNNSGADSIDSLYQDYSEDKIRLSSMACLECEDIQKKDSTRNAGASFHEHSPFLNCEEEEISSVDRCSLFMKFCESGLHRLGFTHFQGIDFSGFWKETESFADLIGPYWSLRAALGPVLETIILLDRLLFLQEHSDIAKAAIAPIFDPVLSPRNMALIAKRK